MNLLLDTHTLLWFLSGDKQLSAKARKEIENIRSSRLTSIVSLWEIAIKSSLNKLNLHVPFSDFEKQLYQNDIQILPLTFQDILTSHSQPFHHRDPLTGSSFRRPFIIDSRLLPEIPISHSTL